MKKIIMVTCSVVLAAAIVSSCAQTIGPTTGDLGTNELSMVQLRDKIAGGRAGISDRAAQ